MRAKTATHHKKMSLISSGRCRWILATLQVHAGGSEEEQEVNKTKAVRRRVAKAPSHASVKPITQDKTCVQVENAHWQRLCLL